VNNAALTSSPPLKKGEDSYEAWFGFNQSTFGGFLFHRSALLRRISAGFTSGLPGPRSCNKTTIHQKLPQPLWCDSASKSWAALSSESRLN